MTKEDLTELVEGSEEGKRIESPHYTLPRNSPSSRIEMVYKRAKETVTSIAKEMGHEVNEKDIHECSRSSSRENHIDLYVYCNV